jgi:hypothetical protein
MRKPRPAFDSNNRESLAFYHAAMVPLRRYSEAACYPRSRGITLLSARALCV